MHESLARIEESAGDGQQRLRDQEDILACRHGALTRGMEFDDLPGA